MEIQKQNDQILSKLMQISFKTTSLSPVYPF